MNIFNKNELKMTKAGMIPKAAWNALVDLIWALALVNVSGGKLTRSRGGTSLSITRVPGGGGGVAPTLALQIVDGSAEGKYQITYGTVNGEEPTLSGDPISGDPDATPTPIAIPEFTVAATTYIWLKVVGTFGAPDTYVVTVEVDAVGLGAVPAGTAITGTGFTSFYLIGYVDFTAGTPDVYEIFNEHSGGNLGVDSWGLYNMWYRA